MGRSISRSCSHSIQEDSSHGEADGKDADTPASQSTRSSAALVRSVSLHWLIFVEMFLTLCMFLRRQLRKIQYICFMRRLRWLLTALPGQDGDKHYKCYLGGRKVFTITHAMKSSLNGK